MRERPHLKSFRDWIRQFFYGICIGIADLMPGISGGTMALILGIYEDIILSIKTFSTKDAASLFLFKFKQFSKAVSWDYLLALLLGMAFTFALLTQVLQYILNDPLYHGYFYALFLGMMLGSVWICVNRIKNWKWMYAFTFTLGATITFFLTGMKVEQNGEGPHYNVHVPVNKLGNIKNRAVVNYDHDQEYLLNVSKSNLAAMLSRGDVAFNTKVLERDSNTKGVVGDFVSPNEPGILDPWLILCGMAAITAMMMPGISGSYVLNVLGAYSIIIGALAEFTKTGEFNAFIVLLNFGIGIAIGGILFSRVVDNLLKNYHDGTMIMLIGFMVGSMGSVWPFFTYDFLVNPLQIKKGPELNILEPYFPSLSNPELYYFSAVAIAGIFAVYFLDNFAKNRRATSTPKN